MKLLIDRTLEAVAEPQQAKRLMECAIARGLQVRVLDRTERRDMEPLCGVPDTPNAGSTGTDRR